MKELVLQIVLLVGGEHENSQKIVVAPKKWLAINPHNYKWSCENWIEI